MKRACLLTMLVALTGCVPAPLGKYYKPIYSDASATYAGDSCGGRAGAPVTLNFVVADGVTFNVHAYRSYGEQARQDLPLAIEIGIPQHTEVQFVSDDFRVSQRPEDLGQKIPVSWTIGASVTVPSAEIVDMDKIAPTRMSDGYTAFSARTYINFSWEYFVPAEISMQIPAITVLDKNLRSAPPIDLIAKSKQRFESYPRQYGKGGSLIYPTAQAEEHTRARYSHCREQTPTHWCENIWLLDDGKYQLEQAGFSYSGRWYVFNVDEKSPFRGEIDIKYNQPLSWKFASNQIQVKDVVTGDVRSYQFDKLNVLFSYVVPFQTAFRGGEAGAKISFSASLGNDEPDAYYIRLPSIRIDGKVYVIKPIKLERRSLDLGLMPLNC